MEKPECELGYTEEQLKRILGDRIQEFRDWMFGQTMAICEGRQYNHETKQYEPTNEGPHGFITYAWDLQRFLDGQPIID